MAEIQESSGGRLLPMGVVPFWDVEVAVAEVARVGRGWGLRGLNSTSSPQDHGLPDLGSHPLGPGVGGGVRPRPAGELPHRGQRLCPWEWFGSVSWPSLNTECRMGLGVRHALSQQRPQWWPTSIYAGVLERHPDLQLVTVESGVGWIPFLLRALDYQLGEMGPRGRNPPALGPVGVLPPAAIPRVLFWFESGRCRPGRRGARLGPPHVRDRLPPPDLPVPRRPGVRGGHPRAHRRGGTARGHGRTRHASTASTPPSTPPVRVASLGTTLGRRQGGR